MPILAKAMQNGHQIVELIWLEDFVALAKTGNFSRAAELRHVSQPAFSRRIRALEDWLGVDLFERGTQGVTLTPVGEQFRSGAEEVVRRIRQLCSETREAGSKEAKTLYFAATHVLSFTFFPEWIRSLYSDDTLGTIKLISDSMQACESLMLQGLAQFLLCHHHAAVPSRFAPTQFQSVEVGEDSLVLLCAPDSGGLPRWRFPNAERSTPYLAYSDESGLGRIIAATQTRETMALLKTVVTSRLAAALLSMVRSGQGVAWLPLSLAEQDVRDGRLVRAAGKDCDIRIGIRIFRPCTPLSGNAEKFWTRLQNKN